MFGIVVKSIKDLFTIKHLDKIYVCKTKGTLKNKKIIPIVGDTVVFNEEDQIINKVLARKNMLIRPLISNVDNAIIVVSVKEPSFSSHLLDKTLIIAEYNKVNPIIYFSKIDLLSFREKLVIKKYIKYYKKIGYQLFTNRNYQKLKRVFANKTTVITGQSGVGKSTLLNKLDKNLSLKTDVVSVALGRGKNTTRHVQLYDLFGGLVADSPGFSALDFIDISKEAIRDNMIEFRKYKDGCKYQNCLHLKEKDCKVKEMVKKGIILSSRYENYKNFIETK